MRRLAVVLVFAAACRSSAPVADGSQAGAASPRAAVDQYLAAAKAQDLQALGAVWGDEKGPTRDRTPRAQLEQLEFIQLCLLHHDQARVGEPTGAPGGRFAFMVEMTQGTLKANVPFTTAKGPSNRWFVQDFDAKLLQNMGFCKRP